MNKKLLTMGLAALLMAGCSSDDSAVKGYVGLTITMPTSAGSRAVEYDDGDTDDYSVKDVTLVFSEYNAGTRKHDIKQVVQFTSTDWNKEGTGIDDITSASVLPVVPMADANAKSVLVLVNSSDIFTVANYTTDPATGNNTVLNPGSIAFKGGSTISTIEDLEAVQNSASLTLDQYKSAGIGGAFMANASIKNATNLDANDPHKQLVVITPQKSKEAAMAAASSNVIYVERAVAKVSLTFNNLEVANKEYTFSGTGFTSDKIEFDGWVLDVTNKSTFPLRRIAATWPNLDRFAPAKSAGVPQRYEWSVDNNYSEPYAASDFNTVDEEAVTNVLNTSLYCFENTFDLSNMKQNRTTRVVLRGQIKPNGTAPTGGLFRLGESVTFYSKADMLAKVKAAVVASGAVSAADIESANVENLVVGKAPFTHDGNNKIVITKTGSVPVDLSTYMTKITGMLGQLTYYEDGYCYYPVRIRHFEDGTDPYDNGVSAWNAGNTYDMEAKWLGRYGVVRNNSYVINVTGVSAPGTPTVPGLTENIDDEEFYYIQATVKVLSWTKRTQNVEL